MRKRQRRCWYFIPLRLVRKVLVDSIGHYSDVTMGTMTSQTTSLMIVYSTVYSDADQRKHQSSAPLAFVRGIHRWPVNSLAHRASNAENVSILWRHHDPNQWRMTQFATCIYRLQCLTKNIINDACPWAVWEYHISLLYTIRRAQQKLKNDTRPDIIEVLQLAEKHVFIDRQFQYRFDHTMSCHYGA